MDVLAAAAQWHCLPSEVQKYGDAMYLANRWGVSPEKVVGEGEIWYARQLYIDKMKAKTNG